MSYPIINLFPPKSSFPDFTANKTAKSLLLICERKLSEMKEKNTSESVSEEGKGAQASGDVPDKELNIPKEEIVVDDLSAAVTNLKLTRNEAQEGDEDDDGVVKSCDLTERGPNNGIAKPQMGFPMKNAGLPLYQPSGEIFQCNYMYQQQSPGQHFGKRPAYDDEEEPSKYTRPNIPMNDYNVRQQQMQRPNNFQGFIDNSFPNNLNQGIQRNIPTSVPFNTAMNGQEFVTKDIKMTKGMAGGRVTVQSPLSESFPPYPVDFDVDDYLGGVDSVDAFQNTGTLFSNVPEMTNQSSIPTNLPEFNNFNASSFSDYRRRSDNSDSGVDSQSESAGSPWSDVTSSPGSYASPPSVDSGCGQSPQHESQHIIGVSPKYHGAPSPGYHRTTPSPASSGYGASSDDSNSMFALNEEELLLTEGIIMNMEQEEREKKKMMQAVSRQQPGILPGTFLPHSAMGVPPMVQPPKFMTPPVSTIASPQNQAFSMPPNTGSPQYIIITPVQIAPAPKIQQTKAKPRAILPKIASQPQSTGTTSSSTTVTSAGSPQTKPRSTAGRPPVNRNNPQGKDPSRLLMMARRTVADMPRESLMKSDEEGDTTLHILVLKQDAHLVQAMLERLHRENLTYLVDHENNKRQTPLYLAVCTNQPKMVAMFVKFQANVNVLAQNISVDGTTMEVKGAIHVGASCGLEYHRTLGELLKSKDININLVNSYGQTALHCAILAHGRMKRDSMERLDSKLVIETLIKAGADPSAQDKKSGRTPLMYAIEQKSVELVETVLKCVPKDRVRNVVRMQAMDGSTCLKIAEGLKGSFDMEIWNRLWNMLQSASNGSAARYQSPIPQEIYNFQVATSTSCHFVG
ncbi:uncharacterized protein LOC127861248 [Dreissena polymorpha]|nr:uncharacterized protein LOC127861248 [Dreissena polymorpha]